MDTLKMVLIVFLMKIHAARPLEIVIHSCSSVIKGTGHFLKNRAVAVFSLISVLSGLLILRAFSCGIQYFPQLDDYIQYWYYPGFSSFEKLNRKMGILGSRPLAGMMDYYVWGKLPDLVCVVILCILLAVSAVIFREVLRRYYDVSPVFSLILVLLPLGMEGTYWLSASTRVVMSMFTASLAVAVFAKWLDHSTWRRLVLFLLLMVIPYGFYEQGGVLAAAMVFVMAYWERRRKLGRGIFSLWAVAAAGLSLVITRIFSIQGTTYSSRADYALSKGLFSDLQERWWEIFRQTRRVLINGDIALIFRGFRRGIEELLDSSHLMWFLLVVLFCIFLGIFAYYDKSLRRHRKTYSAVWASALWIVMPFLLFSVVPTPWICFRNAVTSFVGLAFIADHFLLKLLRWTGGNRARLSVIASLMCLVFMICGLSEVHDYSMVHERDLRVADDALVMIAEDIEKEGYDDTEDKYAVLGADRGSKLENNYRWNDHIEGCTSQRWAFSGLMRYVSGDRNFPPVVPLDPSDLYDSFSKADKDPLQFNHLYWYDEETGAMTRVRLMLKKGSDEKDPVQYWELINEAGESMGTIAEKKYSARVL